MTDDDLPATESEVHGAIVEVQPGLAIFVGDGQLDGVELLPLDLLDLDARRKLTTSVAQTLGWANVAAQAGNGAIQAQGLMRYAPETKALLAAGGEAMYSQGKLTGNMMLNGKFAGPARLIPAGSAEAAAVAASAGTAIVMVAIQAQLAQIQRTAEAALRQAEDIFDTIKTDQWSQVTGAARSVNRAYDEALHSGAVTDRCLAGIRHLGPDLEAHVARAQLGIEGLEAELASVKSQTDRQRLLNKPRVLREVQGLILATESLRMFRLLEAANANLHVETDEREARRRDRLVELAEAENRTQRDHALRLLSGMRRELNLAAVLGASKWNLSIREWSASRSNAATSRQLADVVDALGVRMGLPGVEDFSAPAHLAVEGEAPAVVLKGLPWVSESEGERLIGLAEVNDTSSLTIADLGRKRWIAVTDVNTYVLVPKNFESGGAIEVTIPNSDIRFVRVSSVEGKAPAVSLMSLQDDLRFEFGGWAKEGEGRAAAEQLGQLLASRMSLPALEVPVVAIPELDGDSETTAAIEQ